MNRIERLAFATVPMGFGPFRGLSRRDGRAAVLSCTPFSRPFGTYAFGTAFPATLHVRDERASASGVDLAGGSINQAEFYDMETGKPIHGADFVAQHQAKPVQEKPEPCTK